MASNTDKDFENKHFNLFLNKGAVLINNNTDPDDYAQTNIFLTKVRSQKSVLNIFLLMIQNQHLIIALTIKPFQFYMLIFAA